MGERLRLNRVGLLIGLCAFVGIGILRWPLLTVVLLLAPLSIVLAWRAQP